MKKITTIVMGLSLLASSALYASSTQGHDKKEEATANHMGDHMHKGKMQNHMNENAMTDAQMKENMKNMDHGKMMANMDHDKMMKNMDHGKMGMSSDSMKPYHHNMMTNGYKVTLSSKKALTDGKNHMTIMLMKNGKAVKNADVSIKFDMPSMPGMDFTQQAKGHGKMYTTVIDFSMGGEWAYELMFKTSDGAMHKTKGSVNLK